MLHEQRRQTDRLVAQVVADQLVSARRFVALIEEQIKRLQDRVQAPRQFAACGNLEGNSRLADALAGAFRGTPLKAQFCIAFNSASCTTSSASCRFSNPRIRVSVAIIFPASCRKRWSTT